MTDRPEILQKNADGSWLVTMPTSLVFNVDREGGIIVHRIDVEDARDGSKIGWLLPENGTEAHLRAAFEAARRDE